MTVLERGEPAASHSHYDARAERARASFGARFVREDLGYLPDAVDGFGGDELALRPTQLFAVSLPYPLLEGAQAASTVDAAGRALADGDVGVP